MRADDVFINESDFERLSGLLDMSEASEATNLLAEELDRAIVVADHDLPGNVVHMNSTVTFRECGTGKISSITLVYPHDANVKEHKISILSPVGSALIGLQVGQTINWPFPSGIKTLEVLSVDKMPIGSSQQ